MLALYEYGVILTIGGAACRINAVAAGGVMAASVALGRDLLAFVDGGRRTLGFSEMFSRGTASIRWPLRFWGAFLGFMPAHLALIRDLRPYGKLTFLFLSPCGSWTHRPTP